MSIDLLAGLGLLASSEWLAILGIDPIRFRFDREEDLEFNI